MIRATRGRFFLEFFCGTAALSKAVARMGIACHVFDNKHGPVGDVLLPDVEKRIFALLSTGKCAGVWMGMPCGTLSRARRGNERGGPKPLRGEEGRALWGLPDLTGLDLIRVRAANRLIRFMMCVAEKCFDKGVPYYIENPLTSRLWKFPCIHHIWKCAATRFDYCQFGMKWRKATRILSFNNPVFAASGKQCRFTKDYKCCATGRRHIVLSGVDKSGQFLTSRAEAYPPRLCKLWAKNIQEVCVSEFLAASRGKVHYK